MSKEIKKYFLLIKVKLFLSNRNINIMNNNQ